MLQPPDYSVVEKFSRSVGDLGELQTVWYVWPDGTLGDWRDQGSRRLSVREAAARRDFPNKESYDYVQTLISEIRASSTPPQLVLPCYRAQRGEFIMLDGNHRAVAAFRSGVEVRLLAFAVTGPDDPLLLPDLLHETNAQSSPDLWADYRTKIERKFKQAT